DNYEGGKHARQKTLLAYLAGKTIHVPLFPIVEEDVVDGTLAAHHKAVLLPGIDYLPPKVITALEAFIAGGGTVVVSDESQVKIKGAVKLGTPLDTGLFDQMTKLWNEKKAEEMYRLNTAGNFLRAVEPAARALKAQLQKAGIKPLVECDTPGIIV